MSHPLYENLRRDPNQGGAGPRTAEPGAEHPPGAWPAPCLASRKIPVRPALGADEYCGTRFRSSRREARSIDTQPSNLVSVPYGARAWPIEPGILPRAGVGSNAGTRPAAPKPPRTSLTDLPESGHGGDHTAPVDAALVLLAPRAARARWPCAPCATPRPGRATRPSRSPSTPPQARLDRPPACAKNAGVTQDRAAVRPLRGKRERTECAAWWIDLSRTGYGCPGGPCSSRPPRPPPPPDAPCRPPGGAGRSPIPRRGWP
ncbi:hypothetical protein SCALM49S_02991 [Streptomyces californicus]